MKLKVHRPVLSGIVENLRLIFEQGYYADKVIERSFKSNPKWGGRDRRIVAESVYEIVRNYLLLKRVSELSDLEAEDPYLKMTWIWFETFQNHFDLSDNPYSGKKEFLLKIADSLEDWEKNSFPFWLDQEMKTQRGPENWARIRPHLNQLAPVFLRTNLLKATAPQVRASLGQEGIEAEVLNSEALMLSERKNIFSTKSFRSGEFEVQDLHSQVVVDWLEPQPGEVVIDACAGAGGKTLHISSRMKNKGKVIALDVTQNKLNQLKLRARRAGVHNLEIKLIENSKVIKRLKKRADRLLLDVPCSGLGVLRRNPDTKWKLTPERIQELELIQSQILNEYTGMVKDGGVVVYSTCSLLPSET